MAATATSNYIADHLPPSPTVETNAAIAGYNTGYWWAAAFFAGGAIVAALLFRRHGHGLTVGQHTEEATPAASGAAEN